MNNFPYTVILTGAGVSAESGISTFRASNGLWEQHNVEDVATPEGFSRNPALVQNFYNARRAELAKVAPNEAHKTIARLQRLVGDRLFLITQNIDDLHERAGSSSVLHLHGELLVSRSIKNPHIKVETRGPVKLGDLASDGAQLRPHVVFFGEEVPELERGAKIVSLADIFIVVGTSLAVYPAAGLVNYVQHGVPCFLIDPNDVKPSYRMFEHIRKGASEGVPELCSLLISNI